MKYLLILSVLCSTMTALAQEEVQYYHDGEYHFLVNGVDISQNASSILLDDAIMFEYDAKIYLIKQTDAVKDTGKKLAGTLVNDRTSLKGWGIDFYTKIGDSFVIYFNGAFRNPDQFFLGVDNTAYGYGDNSYFRLNKYETAAEGVFEEIFVYEDGIWWRDGAGQLYGLRSGEPFQGDVNPFKKGLVAKDANTDEYLWFADYTGKREKNQVMGMQVIPEAIVISIASDRTFGDTYSFFGQFFYQGKSLSDASIEREMDDDKTIYYFDPEIGKAFYGEVPESGQIMEVTEIEVPASESKAYWISDNSGQTYLQIGDDIWLEDMQKKGSDTISETDRSGNFYQYSGPSKLTPWLLYPAKVFK